MVAKEKIIILDKKKMKKSRRGSGAGSAPSEILHPGRHKISGAEPAPEPRRDFFYFFLSKKIYFSFATGQIQENSASCGDS